MLLNDIIFYCAVEFFFTIRDSLKRHDTETSYNLSREKSVCNYFSSLLSRLRCKVNISSSYLFRVDVDSVPFRNIYIYSIIKRTSCIKKRALNFLWKQTCSCQLTLTKDGFLDINFVSLFIPFPRSCCSSDRIYLTANIVWVVWSCY